MFAAACSSPENAGQSLPLHVDGPRSALDRDRMAPGAQAAYVIVVPTRTLDSVLEEADAPVPIDLLSIDVEGHETEVLRGFDFARWQPLLILIEDHVDNLRTHRYLNERAIALSAASATTAGMFPLASASTISPQRALGNLAQVLSGAAVPVAAQCFAPGPAALRRLVGGALGYFGPVQRARFTSPIGRGRIA